VSLPRHAQHRGLGLRAVDARIDTAHDLRAQAVALLTGVLEGKRRV